MTFDQGDSFAARVVRWQAAHGRHDLPWQNTGDPYRVWLSEIMLQQTQVATVIPYYLRFVQAFADVASLARAPVDDVMLLWSGLGYYTRARNLHRCAQQVMQAHGGVFPREQAALEALPGIGRSTAAAIRALAFGESAAILDGNVKRVFARRFGIEGFPGEREVVQRLWAQAERELPPARAIAGYTQGLMDLGATVCTRSRPSCDACPLAADCVARLQGRIAELPAARPRRRTPLRRARLLVFRQRDSVMLEKRPPAGIWGGLWSVPQVDGEGDAYAAARAGALSLALEVQRIDELPLLRHEFTHFRLEARVLVIEVNPNRALSELVAQDAPRIWQRLDALAQVALPAPIRTLLASLRDGAPATAPAAAAGT